MTEVLRNKHDVRKMIITGDFNSDEAVFLKRGFRELKSNRNFHQHTSDSSRKFIDRIFVNFSDVGFLDVLPSVEKRAEKDERLGHKVAILWIGSRPDKVKEDMVNICSFKKLRKEIKTKPIFSESLSKMFQNNTDIELKKRIMDEMCAEFVKRMQEYRDRATKSVRKKVTHVDHIMAGEIEKIEQQNACGKKPEKNFYKYVGNLKNGLIDSNDKTKPSCEKLTEKLNNKLEKLNKCDYEKAYSILDSLYDEKDRVDFEKRWGDNLREFRRAVLSTSNSGAHDAHGLSLKHTKVFLSNNTFLKRFKEIVFNLFEIGYMPADWKKDNIHFIFKNKGLREDPAN